MANSITTTGTLTLDDRVMQWRLYLEELSVNHDANTSTMGYKFEFYFTNGSTGGWGTSNSIMLQVGINTDYDILDCFYIGTTKQTSITSGKNYTTSGGDYRFPVLCTANTYTVAGLVGGNATAGSTVLKTVQNSSLGTIDVPHNADGTGTAVLKVRYGKYSGGGGTSAKIKSFQSSTLTLTPTYKTKIYNGSEWVAAIPYIYNGTEWKQATAYVYDSGEWKRS